MEKVIINKNMVKVNSTLKTVQKKAKKYYGDKLFSRNHGEPKAKVRKLADIENIEYISIVDNESSMNETGEISRDKLIAVCREHKLCGRSGDGFLTADKLNKYNKSKGILLINAVECDPGLVHDAWLYRNEMSMVKKGVAILNKCYNFKRILLTTKEPIIYDDSNIEYIKVKDRFPMGYEKFIIKTILGIDIEKNEYPSDKGILVLNIQTIIAIAEMFSKKIQSESRYLTVADVNNGKAVTVKAQIGMRIQDVYNKASVKLNNGKKGKIYTGTGAFGCHAISDDECVSEETNYIALGDMPDYDKSKNCVGCGGCSRNCPMGVKVSKIIQYVEKNGREDASKCAQFNPQQCIGCGVCTYVCKAGKDTRSIVSWAAGK